MGFLPSLCLPRPDFQLPRLDLGCESPPAPPRDGTRVSPHGRRPRLPAPPLPLPLPSFAFWVLGQLRPVLVQPARWAPNSETGVGVGGVTQSGPFPRSWIMGVQQCRRSRIRDEQRDRRLPGPDPPGLPRGTESKNNPIVRPASFPPARGGFTPLIGPRGTASLLAVFPLGPGCLLRRWGRMGAL